MGHEIERVPGSGDVIWPELPAWAPKDDPGYLESNAAVKKKAEKARAKHAAKKAAAAPAPRKRASA